MEMSRAQFGCNKMPFSRIRDEFSVYTYIYIYINIYVCTYSTYVYIYIYTHVMCVYIYIYIYIYNCSAAGDCAVQNCVINVPLHLVGVGQKPIDKWSEHEVSVWLGQVI